MTTSAGAASGNGRACSGVAHIGHMPCESSRRPAFCDISIRRVRFGMPRAGNGGLVARGIEHQICAGCDDVSARCEEALSLPQWLLLSLMPAAGATPCSLAKGTPAPPAESFIFRANNPAPLLAHPDVCRSLFLASS